jgi:DegV family protein with EDD domain
MAIRFIIDSASDFDFREAERNGDIFLPMSVVWQGEQYRDQIDMAPRAFYEKLIECDELPTTCQLTPYDYTQAFERITSEGDEAIAICLSSKLSGSCQSATIAASEFESGVYVVDSLNAAMGEQVLVRYAMQLREKNMYAEDIVRELNSARERIRLIALVDTLEYLRRGGRVSTVTAAAGTLLAIKPVVAIENGEVAVIGKARGSKKANNLLSELIERSGGVDFSRPYLLAYSGLNDDMLQKYIADSAHLWSGKAEKLPITPIGSVIGTHVGPGAVGVAFFSNK